MSQSPNKLYEFGAFRLDASERVLWRGGEMLVLPPKVFDTLLVLVEKEGRVVSKSELMEAIWADAFVEESNLSQNIYTLGARSALTNKAGSLSKRFRAGAIVSRPPSSYWPKTQQTAQNRPKRLFTSNLTTGSASVARRERISILPFFILRQMIRKHSQSPEAPDWRRLPHAARSRPASRYAFWAGLGVLIFSALCFGIYQFVSRARRKR